MWFCDILKSKSKAEARRMKQRLQIPFSGPKETWDKAHSVLGQGSLSASALPCTSHPATLYSKPLQPKGWASLPPASLIPIYSSHFVHAGPFDPWLLGHLIQGSSPIPSPSLTLPSTPSSQSLVQSGSFRSFYSCPPPHTYNKPSPLPYLDTSYPNLILKFICYIC